MSVAGGAACQSTAPAPAAAPAVSPDTWATVDGRPITRAAVDLAFRRAQDTGQTISEEETQVAKLSLLEDLIVEEILLAKAAELKLVVSDTELDNAYAEARKDIPDEAFDQELKLRNLTAADMRDGLRRQLLTRKLIEREVTSKVTVTDQEVTDYFNANREQFNLEEDAYHLAQIVVTPGRDAQVANRTGDDATTPQEARAKAAKLMDQLKAGAAFPDLARDYSEDPESAPRGGDLGFVPISALKQAPPALRDAVLKLTPGSARAVEQEGLHTIVYLVAKETAGQRELSTPGVRERLTETLRLRREQLLQAAFLAAARSDADVTNHQARRLVDSRGRP